MNDFASIDVSLHLVLAEDDPSDRLLFIDALEELPVKVRLTAVANGEQLLQLLREDIIDLPDAIFLDLNMPRKNGFAALGEIKRNTELQDIPVIIFSTIIEEHKINKVFRDAAHYFVNKPSDFTKLKTILHHILTLIANRTIKLPNEESFVITGD